MSQQIPLFGFQEEARTWGADRKRLPLFMEMRLGKTRTVIAWLNDQGAQRILVVAPLTVIGSWIEELALLNEPEPTILRNNPTHTHASRWCLVNYEALRARPQILEADWEAVVLDESTRIKNPKAQITKILNGGTVRKKGRGASGRDLVERFPGCQAEFRAILSGLPAPESPMDYFEQFRFLYGSFCGFKNFWGFREHFFQPDPRGWEWHPRPGSRAAIKGEVQRKAFVLSRQQAGIGEQKVYQKRVVTLPPQLRKAYDKAERDFELDHPTMTEERYTNWPMVMNLWLGRMAGGFVEERLVSRHKLDELRELLTGELLEEQVVVWFRFNAEIEAVSRMLEFETIQHRKITGATPYERRDEYRREFNAGKVRIVLCQIKCARYGIDLSAADTAIYYSNSYSLEERRQSEDRIVHPRKQTSLLYVDLVAQDTVDEDVVKALRQKHVESRFFLIALATNFMERRKR